MDFSKYNEPLLVICPNEQKTNLLSKLSTIPKLLDIKFMTKEEFKNNYYFSYDEKACLYLMKKYGYDLDVCKVYLENLYVIDINKNYTFEKLSFLKDLKIELIDNNLLEFNSNFKKWLSNRKIIVDHYDDLELYEEKALNYKYNYSSKDINLKVTEYKSLEEEIKGVCNKIIDLVNRGVDLNKIYLCNVSEEDKYTIRKIFSYYDIPLNINIHNSIYSTKVVQDYLKDNTLNIDDSKIVSKLINVINDTVSYKDDSIEYKAILIDKLKNTYLHSPKVTPAVKICDFYDRDFNEDEYVFIIGFNQDVIPVFRKDISYISDNLKEEVDLYSTDYLNNRLKLITIGYLSNIKNLYLSYRLMTPFTSFYPSPLINEYDIEVIEPDKELYNKSNNYNKINLAKKLDLYNLYGTVDEDLTKLYSHYNINYMTYSNKFTGINNDTYLKHLPYPLKLSYTSINSYNECAFKYYIKYVLNIDPYIQSFPAFIGSLYHKILSLYDIYNINIEEEFNKFLEQRELTIKEKILLIRIKKELIKLIDDLKVKKDICGYKDTYNEKKIDIDISTNVSIIFTGTIDKIMFYQNIEDTYYTIIDYKSGTIDTNIEPLRYGLHMQLPVYLYLLSYSRVFTSPIFTGSYYQNILFNYPNYNESKDNLLLKGYSTDDIDRLEKFDPTYEKSSLIKSMSYSKDKGFGTYSKVMNDDTLYKLLKYTKDKIYETRDKIIEGDFSINPKVYDGKNVSCTYCEYKDLCYKTDKDLNYIDKKEDLSFLEEEGDYA